MDFLTTVGAVALGYFVGRICYDVLHGTPWKSPGGEFLDYMDYWSRVQQNEETKNFKKLIDFDR